MIEREIDVATADGTMNTFVVHPEEGGPHPAVIMLMDAPGVREGLRELARRLATCGYVVALPNLYYRSTRVFDLGPTRNHPDAEKNLERMRGMIASISNAKVSADTGSLIAALDAMPAVKAGKMGAVGYCMSGSFVTVVAAHYADRIAGFASYYGTRLITDAPDSPHRLLSKVKGEGYYSFAETDHYVPLEAVTAFEKHLKDAPFKSRVEVYHSCEHGFAFSDRQTYERTAAERHWERLIALLRRTVG